MKKLNVVLTTMLILAFASGAIACSSVDEEIVETTSSPDLTTTTQSTQSQTVTEIPRVEPGTLCLFYMTYTKSKTTSLGSEGEVKDTWGGIFRYVPNLDQLTQITEFYYSSLGTAKEEYPYTTDGRLFRVWEDMEFEDRICELDLSSGKDISKGIYDEIGTYAAIGDKIYYGSPYKTSTIDPWAPTFINFCVGDLGTGNSGTISSGLTTLGSFYAVGGNLYITNENTKNTIGIAKYDLNSNNITLAYDYPRPTDDIEFLKLFEDQNAFYQAWLHRDPIKLEDGTDCYLISIVKLTPADFEAGKGFELLKTVPFKEGRFVGADADRGIIVLQFTTSDTNHFILYNSHGDRFEDFWLSKDVRHMQILITVE